MSQNYKTYLWIPNQKTEQDEIKLVIIETTFRHTVIS